MEPLGFTSISVSTQENTHLNMTLLFVHNLMQPLILGLDILSKHRLGINWGQDGKMYLHLGNREIVHSISEVFPGPQLRTVSKVTIPPRSSVVIPTKQTNIQPQTSEILQVKENPILNR